MAQSYQISVPGQKLSDLKTKLSHTTFPDELEDSGWNLGAPLADVKRLAAHWKDGYDWRKHEAQINDLPNFVTSIEVDGFGPLDIHFVHQKSNVEGAIPLMFSHGWPGNFLEVTKLLEPLTQPSSKDIPSFHIVAPSLPNFGFSSSVQKPGFGLQHYAEVCHKLMLQLGYDQYVTQGGDWGMMITRTMSLLYPDHVKASHINLLRPHKPSLFSHPLLYLQNLLSPYNGREKQGFRRSQWFQEEGHGYNLVQSTKPQTIGYALADSPVALLAWIYEKLHDWTDGYEWSDDEILTWVSIYWFSTAGPAASVRIYYEAMHTPLSVSQAGGSGYSTNAKHRTDQYVPRVPLGVAHFPRELTVLPVRWARTMGKVVWESEWDNGGHFAATERPDALVGDLSGMFAPGGPCQGVVKGRSGFEKGTWKAKL